MLRALASLVKPRIVALLTLTGVTALLAAGGLGPLEVAAFATAGAAIAAGSATLNCYYDRDLDRHMARTADRPLPSGDLSSSVALAFGVGLLVVGSLVGLATLPIVSVVYMWLGALAYVGLYTVTLKRRHPIGVVLGGSAGSFPVLAGWAAVEPVTAPALLAAALVFAWTPAHAWALAYVYRDDFERAGVATLPAVAGADRVASTVWLSAVVTAVVALALALYSGPLLAGATVVGTVFFLDAFWRFRVSTDGPTAVRAFFVSNTFLAVVFLAWGAGGLGSFGPIAGPILGGGLALVGFGALNRAGPSLRSIQAAPDPTLRTLRSRLPWGRTSPDPARRPAPDGGEEVAGGTDDVGAPLAFLKRVVVEAWRTTKSVYYANTYSWRALKTGGLVFLGFCLWASANILLSYRPGWGWLTYVLAYGFLVAIYGPIHHLVVIPLALRWRKGARGRLGRIGRRLPTAMLAVFVLAVVVLGTFPAGPMTIDFQSALSDAGGDVNPGLHCVTGETNGTETVHCHLDRSDGIGRVVVESGGERLLVDEEPPFDWTIREDELAAVRDEKQFTVIVEDEDGELLRRYTRRLSLLSDGQVGQSSLVEPGVVAPERGVAG